MPTAASASVPRQRPSGAIALSQRRSLRSASGLPTPICSPQRATQTGIHAVVPNVWPIDVFEPCWVFYTLHLAGLFSHPALADEVSKGIARLERCMSARGLGPALHFAADADDTAMALCVLSLAGREPSAEPLRQFESGDLFVTFPGERNASVSTNIHALHAMRKLGRPAPGASAFVEANRTARGIWESDKWHVSWLYPTSYAVAALAHASPQWRDERTLLDAQHKDGGWGSGRSCTFEETAYALFALRVSSDREDQAGRQRISQAVARALDWVLVGYAPRSVPQTRSGSARNCIARCGWRVWPSSQVFGWRMAGLGMPARTNRGEARECRRNAH
ncbi:hypothetical protein [Paraburkholderia youngii]|uniref:prenyltransferase/squalene oxidase repeat-containing protein n=1 Tax=Paraburkholderia youngii TaxID=2782701 RepID=UPI003D254038